MNMTQKNIPSTSTNHNIVNQEKSLPPGKGKKFSKRGIIMKFRLILWLCLLTGLVLSLTNCSEDSSSPTSTELPEQLERFFREGTSISKDYEAYQGDLAYYVNIPEAGDYKLLFTTEPGSFNVVFSVTDASLLTLTFQDNSALQELSLQKGTISSAKTTSEVFEVFDTDTFEMNSNFGTVKLIRDGAIVYTLPTATPTPQATATPESTDTTDTTGTTDDTDTVTATPTPISISGDTIHIVAVGDSLTSGYGSFSGGYPALLETKLLSAGYNVYVENAGVAGEQSLSTDSRFSGAISNAQMVLLMIGTNDLLSPAMCSGDCNTIGHIESMISKALNAGKSIFVATLPPAQAGGSRDWINSDVVALNQEISSLASSYGVSVVNVYQTIVVRDTSIYYDGLHFTDKGYDWIAWKWYDSLTASGVLN